MDSTTLPTKSVKFDGTADLSDLIYRKTISTLMHRYRTQPTIDKKTFFEIYHQTRDFYFQQVIISEGGEDSESLPEPIPVLPQGTTEFFEMVTCYEL